MKTAAYHRPRSLGEAIRLKAADPAARFVAGGTDLLVRGRQPATLISLRTIPGLEGIAIGSSTRIGALTLVADLREHAGLAARHPILRQACRWFASPQIRNVATVGGNLCNASPAADLAPALLVHDATVRVRGADGERELALADFFRGPSETALEPAEILTDILLPAPAPGTVATMHRTSRVAMDIALVSVAVLLELHDGRCAKARVAVGAAAPTPLRLPEVEAMLAGQQLSTELAVQAATRAAELVRPIDDLRTSAAYRRHLVGVHLRRALQELSR